jgi:hypothetical protein
MLLCRLHLHYMSRGGAGYERVAAVPGGLELEAIDVYIIVCKEYYHNDYDFWL